MKPKKIAGVLVGIACIWLAAGATESRSAGVPYSQLTPQQKQSFTLQVQRYGLSADQAERLLDADYLLKVELPGYRQCPFCKGTGASGYQTSQVKSTIRCTHCQGGGRIQRKVDSTYTYKDTSAQTFGSVQSENNYEFIDCPRCGGSGRIVVYACADCGGAGMVAAGPGLYIIGKSQKAASATNTFDVLHLRNGKEINRAQVTRITGDEAELRHSAGMGKYRRDDFTKEDAARLFGAEPEPAGGDLPKDALIDMTVGSSPSYLGACALDMKDVRLLALLMSMGVALDCENSPYLVLAIDKGETNSVAALLSKDASVNARDARGRSALRAAVEKGDRNLASSLLAHDADPNTRDVKSATPLHVAAAKGDLEMVDFLIDHGARMDLADKEGRTPVDYAKRSPLGKKVAENFEIQNTDYARAKTLMAESKFDAAVAIYEKYKDRGAVQSAMVSKGAYFEGRGQLEDALHAYKEANDADGVQRVTGLLQGRQDKLVEAQNLEKAARLDDALAAYVQAGAPDDAKRLALQLAKEMEAKGEFTRAVVYYEAAGDWGSAGKMRELGANTAQCLTANDFATRNVDGGTALAMDGNDTLSSATDLHAPIGNTAEDRNLIRIRNYITDRKMAVLDISEEQLDSRWYEFGIDRGVLWLGARFSGLLKESDVESIVGEVFNLKEKGYAPALASFEMTAALKPLSLHKIDSFIRGMLDALEERKPDLRYYGISPPE